MSDYFDSDELLDDFFIEAEQQVEQLEQNILAMEDDSSDNEAIDEIFRAAHTLKGGSATVQMTEIAEFTHAVEDLLDGLRSNILKADTDIIDKLLQSLDVIKAMLAERKQGSVYNEDVSELKKQLRGFLSRGILSTKNDKIEVITKSSVDLAIPPDIQGDSPLLTVSTPAELSENDLSEMFEFLEEGKNIYRLRVEFDESNPMNSIGSIQVFAVVKKLGKILRTSPDFDELYKDDFYQFVDYYVLSEENSEFLVEKCEFSDVTLSVGITDIQSLIFLIRNPAEGGNQEKNVVLTNKSSSGAIDIEVSKNIVPGSRAEIISEGDTSKGILTDNKESDSKEIPLQTKKATTNTSKKSQETQQSHILRVDSRRIDSLLNLVSELVIVKGGFNQSFITSMSHSSAFPIMKLQFSAAVKDLLSSLPRLVARAAKSEVSLLDLRKDIEMRFSGVYTSMDDFEGSIKQESKKISGIAADLGRITGELHEGVLKVRMVPVDQVFQRFPRLVRDLSRTLGKTVKLNIVGGETEMDKTVTEELVDPLMHCVRNSMDHGIETPSERLAAGKPEGGSLTLRASNQGNIVVIDIIDDGRGINVNNIKKCGVERGLISPGTTLTDSEIFSLIMEPGFSTAEKVTDLSGRGVGLDVVKRSIERLNGEINISSEWGKGSVFTIKLPLTLAILQGLLVRVGTDIYAIPITNVLESFRVKSDELRLLDGTEVFNVREDVISIIRLSKIFGIESHTLQGEFRYLVLVGSEEKKVALLVDELIGEEDVVIKPLKDRYTGSQGIAGATILGDGTVSLIIDIGQLLTLGFKQQMESHGDSEKVDLSKEYNNIVIESTKILETEAVL